MGISDEEKRAKHAAYMRLWKQKNQERVKELRKREREKNKEKYRERNRKWREENKDHLKQYRDENRESLREGARRRREKNKERDNEKKLLYYHRNKEKILERNRQKRKDNPEEYRQKSKIYRERTWEKQKRYAANSREKNRVMNWFCRTRATCKKLGIPFDLTPEWIAERLEDGCCELSGVPFDMQGKKTPNSPSIDRRDPGGGYLQSNCRMIIWFLNRAMSNLGEEYAMNAFLAVANKRLGLRISVGDSNG